jgi:hypothetical protein
MSCMHSDGMVCDSCAPAIYLRREQPNLVSTPQIIYTPLLMPSASQQPKVASTDYIEGALNERRRIVDALKNAGHDELARKIDRGDL